MDFIEQKNKVLKLHESSKHREAVYTLCTYFMNTFNLGLLFVVTLTLLSTLWDLPGDPTSYWNDLLQLELKSHSSLAGVVTDFAFPVCQVQKGTSNTSLLVGYICEEICLRKEVCGRA